MPEGLKHRRAALRDRHRAEEPEVHGASLHGVAVSPRGGYRARCGCRQSAALDCPSNPRVGLLWWLELLSVGPDSAPGRSFE